MAEGNEQSLFPHLSCSVSTRAEKFLCSVSSLSYTARVWGLSGAISGRVPWHVWYDGMHTAKSTEYVRKRGCGEVSAETPRVHYELGSLCFRQLVLVAKLLITSHLLSDSGGVVGQSLRNCVLDFK